MALADKPASTTGDGAGSEQGGSAARVGGSLRRRVLGRGDHRDLRPHRLRAFWSTTIGKKYVVAITGLIMAVWVVLHMLGNLKEIEGPGGGDPAIDRYSHWLRTAFAPVLPHDFLLWVIRAVTITALVLHLTAVYQLWQRNRRAKPALHRSQRVRSTLASRTMTASGILILAFLIFHILHFTTRTIHPTPMLNGAVYANLYNAFHLWWLVVIYVGAMVLLGMHLFHGLWSSAQTTGKDNPDRNWFWRRFGAAVAVLTAAGFAAVPLAVAFGAFAKPIHPHSRTPAAYTASR
jgi:succinate dehydrogenase / fumarate reductase cytochrome b subunit